MFGPQTQTAGGKGIKFYASTRLQLSKRVGSKLKEGDVQVGIKVTAEAEKNRMARPFNPAEVYILFDEGMDIVKGFFDYLIYKGEVVKKGAWCQFAGSSESFQQKDFIENFNKLDDEVKDNIRSVMEGDNITPEITDYLFNL